jgi:hypothetical protein
VKFCDKLNQNEVINYQKSSKCCLNAYRSPFFSWYLMIMSSIMCLLWSRRRIMNIKVWLGNCIICISNRCSFNIIKLILKFAIVDFDGMLSPMAWLAILLIIENIKYYSFFKTCFLWYVPWKYIITRKKFVKKCLIQCHAKSVQ